ncbi:MAG: magnesium transporter CorA family protein [Candidatus Taylorbacteria bacterium]|nr:magnesium transporter CorA family protein [Candidatus Taylorbacteria bacterium]
MIHTYAYKDVTWVDLENPTPDEVREIMGKYAIHPLAAEELLLPTTRSKVDTYDDFIYLILHFPAWKHSHKENTQEVDFIIGKKFIVTARYDTVDALHKFAKMFEVNSILKRNDLVGKHAGYMFYYMIREIYHSLHDELESVRDSLDDIEKKIFRGKEREMVFEISDASRELLSFKHATSLHEEVLKSYAAASEPFFGKDYGRYISAMQNEHLKVNKTVIGLSETLSEMRETNNSLLETKQNKIVQTLTVITFITSLVAIFIALLQLDAISRPILGRPNDFWIVVAIVVIATGLMTAAFKRKKWF